MSEPASRLESFNYLPLHDSGIQQMTAF